MHAAFRNVVRRSKYKKGYVILIKYLVISINPQNFGIPTA